MDIHLAKSLISKAFESSNIFIGIYNKEENDFEYINKKGLNLLKINDISEYKKMYPNGIFKKSKQTTGEKIIKNNILVVEEEDIFINHAGDQFYGILHKADFDHNDKKYEYFNISKIKLADKNEQHIIDQENRFEALFMHAAIGIIVVEKSSKIVLSNRFANVLFGYEQGEMIDQPLEILIPQNVRERHKKTYEEFVETPKARPMGVGLDLKGRKKDGSLFPVEISLSNFVSENTQYFICFINDMTFKKKAEDSLISKNTEIQKLNESLENEVIKRTQALVETLRSLEKSKKNLEVA